MNDTSIAETAPAPRNLGYYELGYAVFFALFFAYVIYLYRKKCRLEKERRP